MIHPAGDRRYYRVKAEMFWKVDEQVEAARKAPGWLDFHRACGRGGLYFDHIEREGRRGPYKANAFTLEKRGEQWFAIPLAVGSAKTPIEAVADAYQKSGRPVADRELDFLCRPPSETPDFEDILG